MDEFRPSDIDSFSLMLNILATFDKRARVEPKSERTTISIGKRERHMANVKILSAYPSPFMLVRLRV